MCEFLARASERECGEVFMSFSRIEFCLTAYFSEFYNASRVAEEYVIEAFSVTVIFSHADS